MAMERGRAQRCSGEQRSGRPSAVLGECPELTEPTVYVLHADVGTRWSCTLESWDTSNWTMPRVAVLYSGRWFGTRVPAPWIDNAMSNLVRPNNATVFVAFTVENLCDVGKDVQAAAAAAARGGHSSRASLEALLQRDVRSTFGGWPHVVSVLWLPDDHVNGSHGGSLSRGALEHNARSSDRASGLTPKKSSLGDSSLDAKSSSVGSSSSSTSGTSAETDLETIAAVQQLMSKTPGMAGMLVAKMRSWRWQVRWEDCKWRAAAMSFIGDRLASADCDGSGDVGDGPVIMCLW